MTTKAYVLIDTAIGKAGSVAATLRKSGMDADTVTGPHDIIAVLQAPDPDGLAKIVMNEIHGVQGITRTTTCIVVH